MSVFNSRGEQNSWAQFFAAKKTLAHNICCPSVWYVLYTTILAPRIFT